jgi:hypothetical protein
MKAKVLAWPMASPRLKTSHHGIAPGAIKGRPVWGTLIGRFFFLQLTSHLDFVSPLVL